MHSSDDTTTSRRRTQARYWLCTIPRADWTPCLPSTADYCRGQLERGDSTGYEHWQLLVTFPSKKTLRQVKNVLCITAHCEPSLSKAANDYVWKEDSRIGEPFEFGIQPFNRNSKTDWDRIRLLASTAKFEQIPSEIYIRYYSNLHKIRSDHLQPLAIERTCFVYWGPTGTGKSHRAWAEAGSLAYSKDPRTKFWCGYGDQCSVIIDEFRGSIDISHLLRWLDKYPVRVETKGSSRPLVASKIWITSNLHPNSWFPDLDYNTYLALERRLIIEEMNKPFTP
jgi:RNA helicase